MVGSVLGPGFILFCLPALAGQAHSFGVGFLTAQLGEFSHSLPDTCQTFFYVGGLRQRLAGGLRQLRRQHN